MRIAPTLVIFWGGLLVISASPRWVGHPAPVARTAPALTLCAKDETVVFSCQLKNSPKTVSLCSSSRLTKTQGYLQYRFGLPGKVELEYPKQRSDSQKSFHYSHYFRAQFDSTEISFSTDDYTYTVFDNFNGEEKPAIMDQGVTVKPPGNKKEVTYSCRDRAKANLGNLPDAFENESSP